MQRQFRVRKFTWPVHWQGYRDYQRHQDRLNLAFSKGDETSVGREVLTVCQEGKTRRLAFQFLRQYGFEFDSGTGVRIGHFQNLSQGSVPLRPQSVIRAAGVSTAAGPGTISEPGVREAWEKPELGSDELYRDWILPGLSSMGSNSKLKTDTQKSTGPLDAKRTLLANLARNSRGGKAEIRNINREDLRYRSPAPVHVQERIPVVFLLQDVSSSMGETWKALSRYGFYTTVAFLNSCYPQARPVFIIHDVAAREVGSEEFFSVSGCGGTRCASAYRLMLEAIQSKTPWGNYVFYGIHISDGNTRLRDGLECGRLARELLEIVNGFAYLQVGDKSSVSIDNLAESLFPVAGEFSNGAFLVEAVETKEEMDSGLSGFFRNSPEALGRDSHG